MNGVIKLRSHDRWHEIADYDIHKRIITRVYEPELAAYSVATSGHFCQRHVKTDPLAAFEN